MKSTLAEVSITLPEGAILKLCRYHETTKTRSGPPHMELVAVRAGDTENKVPIRMPADLVTPGSMQQLLELYRRRIDGIRARWASAPQPEPQVGSLEEFVADMVEAKMFLPAETLAA